jgi:RNA polymerase sigma factor (sigma-70 family)
MDDWETVIAEQGAMVWGTVCRLLGNAADAADCYQEVFAAALAVARREHVGNWGGLLRRLALVHGWKRLKTRMRERGVGELPEVAAREAEPWEGAAAGEMAAWLRRELAQLPGMQGEVFWMVCVEGMRYAEAGAALGVEENHVGVLVHRARGNLRAAAGVWLDEKKR